MSAPLIPLPARRSDGPIAKGHMRYCLILCEWLTHEIWVDAANEDDAVEAAENIWRDEGEDAFRWRDAGIDGIEVIDVEEAQP